jgi:N-acetylmuramoyl-L-alanine amidase/FlgD Ig-like domain
LRPKVVRATLAHMRRPLALLLALVAAGIGAQAALGADGASVTVVDLPVKGSRIPAAATRGAPFDLVGLHWRGPGRLAFRSRSLAGRWSAWRGAAPEPEDAPDPSSPEAVVRSGWRLGSPWWVGPSDRIETRTSGRVSRIRAYLVWSPASDAPVRRPAGAQQPAIVPRASWGADESIRRAPPRFAPRLRFAIVHHTAGTNNYSRAQAPAVVKAIELYHVQGNGWNDIGYNFLVDRFGTIYEGRYGGIQRNVIGAHALGFNTGSAGIAVLGTYGSAAPSQAAQDALARLIAWRLDLAHVDPLSTLKVVSGGSEKYRAGATVTLRAVSGHRDTGSTECPGDALYARLDAIAAAAEKIGGPKIFEPRVEVSKAGPVRFRARLSTTLSWEVSISDADGLAVADATGTGSTIDWTWSAQAPPATYRWSITAGAARPAIGSVRAGTGSTGAALAIQSLAATPSSISPNGDGQADVASVTFTLTTPATVSVDVYDGTENDVLPVLTESPLAAGRQTVLVDGSTLVDGSYTIVVRARGPDGAAVESVVPLTVSRLLGLATASPSLLSPNGDGRSDRVQISFELTAPADVRVRVLRNGSWVATLLAAALQAGHQSLVWDGTRSSGTLRDGKYDVVIEATDEAGTASFALPIVVDTTAPSVRLVSRRPLELAVSEPAILKLTIDGVVVRREVRHAGTIRIRWGRPFRRLTVVAWDAAGNVSTPLRLASPPGPKSGGQ